MEGKGILLHKHSVALVDGEAKSPDPSILRYGEIAINYATDHETISIKNQNDEIATFKTHKLYTQLLGDKQDKTDDTLLTQDKTVVGALNELKTDLDNSVEPYVVNLTNLLSANDSESISSAIGGIENLNSTISKNQVIFGILATGTVAVGIRVFGNQTTLNYFVDSVLGLTINEIAITNTDNTLSKTVETHAVLTENMVINSLNSDETTLPLSAAQGKALDSKISSIDVSADITNAINALDAHGQTASTGEVISSVSQENGVISVAKKTLSADDIPTLPQSKITDLETTLAGKQDAGDYATNSALTEGLAGKQDAGNYVEDISSPFSNAYVRAGTSTRSDWVALLGNGGITIDIPREFAVGDPGTSYVTISTDPSRFMDDSLTTTSKYITGAINELNSKSDVYVIDLTNIESKLTNSEALSTAIGGWDNLVSAINNNKVITAITDYGKCLVYHQYVSDNTLTIIPLVHSSALVIQITNSGGSLSGQLNYLVFLLDYNEYGQLDTTDKTIIGAINEVRETLNSNKAYIINLTPIMSHAGSIVSKDVVDWDNLVTAVQNRVPIQATQIMEGISDVMLYDLQALLYQSSDIPTVLFRFGGNGTDFSVILQLQSNSTNVKITVEERNLTLDVTTLFADTASITSRLSSQIAAYGESSATDFPLMYAGSSIGNIKPTWIRTSAGITNFMCIADNKIWYFEIQGTTVQRASLAIS